MTHSYKDARMQAIADRLYKQLCQNEQRLEEMRSRNYSLITSARPIVQVERIEQAQGKIIYMGAHPKRIQP